MCSFGSVWGMLAAVLAGIGGAVSSAFFGFAWANAGPLAYLSAIGFAATAGWASITSAALIPGLLGALRDYCSCTASVARCASQCSTLTGVLSLLTSLLSAVILVAGVMAFWPNKGLGLALLGLVLAVSAMAITLLVLAANLSNCQRG